MVISRDVVGLYIVGYRWVGIRRGRGSFRSVLLVYRRSGCFRRVGVFFCRDVFSRGVFVVLGIEEFWNTSDKGEEGVMIVLVFEKGL